ncbi:MAG: hypothetical protein Q4D02_02210 [Clostridia bacterium]|nr:hypothetical protein [Clostridia bacterium]
MKSLISECIVLSWVIEKYKEVDKENPCSICEYASEHCKQYLQNGFVPLTGDPIKKIPEEIPENVTFPSSIENKKSLKSTPRKKKGKKKR